MEDNKKFWSRTARIYERFTRGGKSEERAYRELERRIASQLNRRMKVLELAAGPGVLSRKIASSCCTLELTDFSAKMVAEAKKKKLPPNVTVCVADATNLKYDNETFDAVVIANALHIMPNPVKAVSEIKRVLKADGVLIAPTFTRSGKKKKPIERIMEIVGFRTFSRWNHRSYLQFLNEQGLYILEESVITGHNFPISFVVCKYKE